MHPGNTWVLVALPSGTQASWSMNLLVHGFPEVMLLENMSILDTLILERFLER